MRRYLLTVFAALLFAMVTPAQSGDLVAKTDPMLLRLHASPCTSPVVLVHIAVEWHAKFQAASGVLEGEPYTGCWIDEGDTIYFYADDGSGGRLEKNHFEEVPGA